MLRTRAQKYHLPCLSVGKLITKDDGTFYLLNKTKIKDLERYAK